MNVRSDNRRSGSDAEGWVLFQSFMRGWQASRGPARRARGGAAWGAGARRPALSSARILTLVSLCAAVAMTCGASPAGAAITHKLLGPVAEVPATGPHGESIILPGPIGEVQALAVNSGHLWVADRVSSGIRLDMFKASSGEFESQVALPKGTEGFSLEGGIAFGEANGEAVTYLGIERGIEVLGESGSRLATWTGAHTPSGPFSFPASVAVDNDTVNPSDWASGDVFVAPYRVGTATNQSEVDIFKPEAGGQEPAQLVGPPLTGTCPSRAPCPGEEKPLERVEGIAVDQANGELFLAARFGQEVAVFKQGTLTGHYEFVTRITETPSGPLSDASSVAVDSANGDVYVGAEGFADEFKLASSGESLEYVGHVATGTGFSTDHGTKYPVAVDSTDGDLYVDGIRYSPDFILPTVAVTEPPLDVTMTGVTLRGTVNPEGGGEASCEFEWGVTAAYGEHAKCVKNVVEGNSPVAVESTRITGLQPDMTYHFRLDGTNLANGLTSTEGAKDLGTFTTAGPGLGTAWASDVASTSATLTATVDPNGSPTSYGFQYGTSTAYGDETPSEAIGAGNASMEVRGMHLDGLAPSTVYHYRLVVRSELLNEVAPGRFEIRVEAFDGPDQTFTTQGASGAFELPDGRQWEMVSPADKHGARIIRPAEFFTTTQAAAEAGAVTYGTTQPTESQPPGNDGTTQILSTREADGGWVSQDIDTPHDAPGTFFGTEYQLVSANLAEAVVEPSYSRFVPLSPSTSEATAYLRADFPPGHAGEHCTEGCYTPLVTGCPPAGTPCQRAVEEYADVAPGTAFGGYPTFLQEEGKNHPPKLGEASPDLSYIVLQSWAPLTPGAQPNDFYLWSAGKPPGERLVHTACITTEVDYPEFGYRYLENETEPVIPPLFMCGVPQYNQGYTEVFDVAQPGERVPIAGRLEGIGPEAKVFFENEKGEAGQECEARVGGSDKLECAAVPGPGVELAGKSRDGSYIYGYSHAVLSEAPNGEGEKAVAGAENLYVVHHGNGGWEAPRFITDAVGIEVTVSPNGRWMTFNTGGEPAGRGSAFSLRPGSVAHLYSVERGTLVCASCSPTGGRETSGMSEPGPTEREAHDSRYQPRFLSNRGQVFFDTAEALVPKDVNGQVNVYEYEPEGVGGCASATASGSVVYAPQADGCIGLLSSGESSRESLFIDASESGSDVFIYTDDKLVPQDTEGSYSVYDAHECSAVAPCPASVVPPPPCTTGESCKPAPTPQPAIYGAPASATFSGAGNVVAGTPSTSPRACPKGRSLRHGACVKSGRRRKKPKGAKKARRARKASRNGSERRGRS
jgi:hypothetical protein